MSAEETPRRLAARRTNPPVTIRPTASATPTPDPSPRTHPGDASTLLHLAPPSLTALTASNQLKAFIVDYCHANAFPDTAHAFARESHAAEQLDRNIAPTLDKLDRDGDLMQIDDDATQDWPILTQEELAAIRLRRGTRAIHPVGSMSVVLISGQQKSKIISSPVASKPR